MKKLDNFWGRLFGGIIAVVLTIFLFITNAPPFSLIADSETQEAAEISTEEAEATEVAEPSATEAPATDEAAPEAEEKSASGEAIITLGKLIIIVPKPFDLTDVEATEKKVITLLNQSTEPIKVNLFIEGVDSCGNDQQKNCAAFESEVEVEPGKPLEMTVDFKGMTLKSAFHPTDGTMVLITSDGQADIPYVISSKWKQDWTQRLTLFAQILAGLIVTYILYAILYSKVIPFFYFERYIPMQMAVTEENKTLWPIYSNRLALMKGQGTVKNLINPQEPPKTIELPANLGKQGDFLHVLIDLVSWVFPRRGLTLGMSPVDTKTNGKGISVSLIQNRSGKVLLERTFTTKSYDIDPDTMDYQDLLMIPIILWLSDWWEQQYPTDNQTRTDWEVKSYCMLANQLWTTNSPLGREMYMRALFLDPSNREAHAGLGRIWLEESQKEDLSDYEKQNYQELAAAYLRQVAEKEPEEEDRIWFAANYNLAVNLLNTGAIEKAKICSKRIESKIETILSKNPNPTGSSFIQWLLKFRAMALIFRHSISLESKVTSPPNQIRLNNKINIAIRAIRSAVSGRSEKADRSDDKFDPQKILLVGLDYRTQYNAACYFSRCYKIADENKWENCGQYAEAALDYLRMSLGHGGGLAEYARKDQTLKPIRDDKTYKEKFEVIAPVKKAQPEKKDDDELKIVIDTPIILKGRKPYFSRR